MLRFKLLSMHDFSKRESWLQRNVRCWLRGDFFQRLQPFISIIVILWIFVFLLQSSAASAITLAELQAQVSEQGRAILSFEIEVVVCAAVPGSALVIVQDASSAALLDLPVETGQLRAGEALAIRCDHCAITRNRFGLQLGTAPVVDNDGAHAALVKSGKVFLSGGQCPIRLAWFNREPPAVLDVEFEGPEVGRQKIPSAALWHKVGNSIERGNLQAGLDVEAYTPNNWHSLPDFRRLIPVRRDVAANFDVSYGTSDSNLALVFSGFLEVQRPGIYTFYVGSADGAQLWVRNPLNQCQAAVMQHVTQPRVTGFEEALTDANASRWTELDGTVNFVGQSDSGVEFELLGRAETIHATVLSGNAPAYANVLHRRIHVTGICDPTKSRLCSE